MNGDNDSMGRNDSKLPGPERAAKSILKGLGFAAEKIATTSAKSADFAVGGDEPAYLVEVKSRLLDERLERPSGGISEPITKSMRHDAKVGDWLAESKQQFGALDPHHARLWFLWCSMESPLGGLNQVERTISVLYGVREAMDVNPPHRAITVFYATPGAFERFPEIDGAVVVWPEGDGLTLCPNETSPRFNAVMQSKLVQALCAAGVGAMLPGERAALIDGYVVPLGMRSRDHAVLRHVQQVTGLPYLNFLAYETEYMQTGTLSLDMQK